MLFIFAKLSSFVAAGVFFVLTVLSFSMDASFFSSDSPVLHTGMGVLLPETLKVEKTMLRKVCKMKRDNVHKDHSYPNSS